MSYNVLVTGADGQVGSEIKELSSNYEYKFFFTNRKILDITNNKDLKEFININKIKVIINSAAYTSVDEAEDNEIDANKVNHLAVRNLAQIAKDKGISLIHISTDYVFDGENFKPYNEDDKVNPTSAYGRTKLAGENAMVAINPPNSIIIRTSWVYSFFGNNFVKKMITLGKERKELNVVFDQIGTPTSARDLAETILIILPKIKNNKVNIYNYSNEGVLSWYDFSKEIIKMANINCQVNPIESKCFPTKAKRPHYSVLNKSKIKREFNVIIPYWKNSLNNFFEKRKNGIK